jgi:hypothetical protein
MRLRIFETLSKRTIYRRLVGVRMHLPPTAAASVHRQIRALPPVL